MGNKHASNMIVPKKSPAVTIKVIITTTVQNAIAMLIDRGIQCSFEQHFHPIVAVKRAQETLIPPRSSNSNSPFTSNLITTTTGNNIPIIPQMSRNLSQKKF